MTFGYARASDSTQDLSPEIQAERFCERFARNDLPAPMEILSEHESAIELRYTERPKFREIMRVIRPDDHLIVWRMDRIDRKPLAMIAAANWLQEHKVHVHSLDEPGFNEIDFDSLAGQAWLCMVAMASGMWVKAHKEAQMRGIQFRKDHGMAYNKTIPIGHRRIKKGKYKYDVWDENECAQIREITQMYENGMSVSQIAKEYFLRGEVTAIQVPWVKRYKKNGALNHSKVQNAIRWYREVKRQGFDLGDADCPPMYRNGKRTSPPLSQVRRAALQKDLE